MVVNKVNNHDGKHRCEGIKGQFHQSRWQIGIEERPPQKVTDEIKDGTQDQSRKKSAFRQALIGLLYQKTNGQDLQAMTN